MNAGSFSSLDDWPVDESTTHRSSAEPPSGSRWWRRFGIAVTALAVAVGALYLVIQPSPSSSPAEGVEPTSGTSPTNTTLPMSIAVTEVATKSETTLQLSSQEIGAGELVQVTGHGFRPDELVAVYWCRPTGTGNPAELVPGCDTGTAELLKADSTGAVTTEMRATGTINTGDGVYRCVDGCHLRSFSLLSVTASESEPIRVEGGDELLPTVFGLPAAPITDGSPVEVHGANLNPLSDYLIRQCIVGIVGAHQCIGDDHALLARTDGDGKTTVDLRAQRYLFIADSWYDCAALRSARCVIDVQLAAPETPDTGPAPRNPGALALTYDSEAEPAVRRLTVSPATGLRDGDTVVVSAEAPLLRQGQPGISLCAVGGGDVCTTLTRANTDERLDTTTTEVKIPRRFVTWSGAVHDCLDSAPCELRLPMSDTSIIHMHAPIDFAASELLSADEASIDSPGPYLAEHDATVRYHAAGRAKVFQCVIGRPDACDRSDFEGDPATRPSEIDTVEVTLRRLMVTPAGPHDCVTDGPCELRFLTRDHRWVEPLSLEFEPGGHPTTLYADARPTVGLADGQTVEIRLSGEDSLWFFTSLCVADTAICAWLTSGSIIDQHGTTQLRLPRTFIDRFDLDPERSAFDCAEVACVLRVGSARAVVEIPVSFNPDLDPLPLPQLAATTVEPIEGTQLPLLGQHFTIVHPDDPNSVVFRWCGAPDDDRSECVRTTGGNRRLDSQGRLDTYVDVPLIRDTVATAGDPPLCATTCWLVVGQERELPTAALEVAIRSDHD